MMSSTSFLSSGAADKRREGVAEHFEAGLQNHKRDDEAHGAVDVQAPEVLGRRYHERAGREHRVVVGINARSDEGLGVRLVAEALEHDADGDLREDGHHDDDDGDGRVAGRAGVDDLVDGFAQGDEAGHEDDDGDDDAGEVLHAAVAEGVVAVGRRPASFVPTMVTMEDKASVALFTPSKMMAMEWDMNPTAILKATSSTLPIMPYTLALTISLSRFMTLTPDGLRLCLLGRRASLRYGRRCCWCGR